MVFHLLDIAPVPKDWEKIQQATNKVKVQQEKELAKEEQLDEKAAKKAKKAEKKAQKKAERAKKKAEKKAKKNVKNLSAATPKTVATVQVEANQPFAPVQAAMPTGVVLAVCASLMICFGAAWFSRRFNSDTTSDKS